MPELPEVEVTRRSVAGGLLGARVRGVDLGLPLRWPLGRDPQSLVGTDCGEMSRRGKYLWLPLAHGVPDAAGRLPGLPQAGAAPAPAGGLLIHLGMSGALAFGEAPAEREARAGQGLAARPQGVVRVPLQALCLTHWRSISDPF